MYLRDCQCENVVLYHTVYEHGTVLSLHYVSYQHSLFPLPPHHGTYNDKVGCTQRLHYISE